MLPAKANPEKQKEYLEREMQPRLDEAQAGKRVVLFMNAAHFVLAAFLGYLWSVMRIFIPAPSGRQRFNVLGALNAITHEAGIGRTRGDLPGSSWSPVLEELPEFWHVRAGSTAPAYRRQGCSHQSAQGSLTFPANFQLVAAMNPCPCGYYGHPVKPCICSNMVVTKYQKRIFGPLLDRIDIHIEVPRVEYEKFSDSRFGESSAMVQVQVEVARSLQRARFGDADGITSNADMRTAEARKLWILDETGKNLMKSAMNQLQLPARAYHRVLKLVRTIADLAASETIATTLLAEALQYRPCLNMM